MMQSIKSVATKLEISKNALRYYEKEGLIGPIDRDTNGIRQYSTQDIEMIYKIVHLRAMGATIKEIKSLLYDYDENDINDRMIEDLIKFLGELDSRLTRNINEIENQKVKIQKKVSRLENVLKNK